MKVVVCLLAICICFREVHAGVFIDFRERIQLIDKKSGLKYLALAALFAACVLPIDEDLSTFLTNRNQTYLIVQITSVAAVLGDDVNFWSALLILYFGALTIGSAELRRISLCAMLSPAVAGAAAHLLKLLLLRARPRVGDGAYQFFQSAGLLEGERLFQSMPSAQVAVVTGLCAFLYLQLQNKWYRVFLVIPPVIATISKVSTDRHWPSDCVVSFIIAFGVASMVFSCFSQCTVRESEVGGASE